MKNNFLLFLSIVLLFNCKKDDPNISTVPEDPMVAIIKLRSISGEWVSEKGGAGGTGLESFDSFKNFQYNFEVGTNNKNVAINLSSPEIDVQYALFNPLGQLIENSSTGRSLIKTYQLNAGIYRLVICSARRAVGKFGFTIQGVLGDPQLLSKTVIQTKDQNWGQLGGAGLVKSFKNQFYSFEVTDDNTSLDIEIESPNTDAGLFLYDELGQRVAFQYGNRYEFKILPVKKGKYTVMVATTIRGNVGNFQLTIHGKVQNLQKVVSQATTTTGRWANKDATDTYTLTLNSTVNSNSPLDMELSSADANVQLELQNGAGNYMLRKTSNKTEYLVSSELPNGNYRIVVKPYGSGFGNYTLNVHGQFTDFKKL